MVLGASKEVIIDARGHLLGRLASVVAKELLEGQNVTVVRCEGIEQTGSHIRNKFKFLSFLKKRTNTNPKKGPIHERAPSKFFRRVVRGMLPHKTSRGQAAFKRLQCYEGIPHPFDKKKRQVVPAALRILRLAPGRRYSTIGKICSEVGWK